MSVASTPKTHTAGSQTLGSGMSDSARGARRRRTKLATEKKIADDEFMAAAIGDVEWLKQSLRDAGPDINFDKNVSNLCVIVNISLYIYPYQFMFLFIAKNWIA